MSGRPPAGKINATPRPPGRAMSSSETPAAYRTTPAPEGEVGFPAALVTACGRYRPGEAIKVA